MAGRLETAASIGMGSHWETYRMKVLSVTAGPLRAVRADAGGIPDDKKSTAAISRTVSASHGGKGGDCDCAAEFSVHSIRLGSSLEPCGVLASARFRSSYDGYTSSCRCLMDLGLLFSSSLISPELDMTPEGIGLAYPDLHPAPDRHFAYPCDTRRYSLFCSRIGNVEYVVVYGSGTSA